MSFLPFFFVSFFHFVFRFVFLFFSMFFCFFCLFFERMFKRQPSVSHVACRRDQVVDAFRSDCVDIDEKEAQEISSLLSEIGSVTRDCENPQKIVVSQCEKLGLRPGFVVDLNALKPWNGTAWSLRNPKDGEELMNFLDREDPELVIGSSSCDVSDFLKGSSRAMEKQTDFHVCARLCKTTSQVQDLAARSTNQINFARSRVQFIGGKFAKEM